MKNSPLYGLNVEFLEQMYAMYQKNPNSIDEHWQQVMSRINSNMDISQDLLESVLQKDHNVYTGNASNNNTEQYYQLYKNNKIIDIYRTHGYKKAKINPIDESINYDIDNLNQVDPNNTDINYDNIDSIIEKLNIQYCQNVACDFSFIDDIKEKEWLYSQFESLSRKTIEPTLQKKILHTLLQATHFESFLHKRFPGAKRFSIEGAESTIVAMNSLIELLSNNKSEEIIVGMAHRGRLNMLVNIFKKPLEALFAEFKGINYNCCDIKFSGDVKYHLGYSNEVIFNQHRSKITLLNNPSHLEAINPLVVGKVRARQELTNDLDKNITGIIVHGDAALAGQGIVYESLNLSKLTDYTTGGIIHIIINNQIGFTTNPELSRPNKYFPTDIAKAFNIPIIHVNGDKPEDIIKATQIAVKYKTKFKKDFFIDIIGYRKYGHNESDEPRFTQPKMYKKIDEKKNTYLLYTENLLKNNIISENEITKEEEKYNTQLSEAFEKYSEFKINKNNSNTDEWSDIIRTINPIDGYVETGVDKNTLDNILAKTTNIPDDFNVNKKIIKLFQDRYKNAKDNDKIDWATAESLAFGTLLNESHSVRLSGQDSQRGTFSQRHAVITDINTEKQYTPLKGINSNINIVNSYLSEYAALGFEYGYSLVNPNTLTLWEAQFGDFANGAQIIMDQFISSAEEKWLQMSNIVLLLPHGYEGQGPEHSSARIERFLQLSARFNWYIINCTTPANYFHVLRRQVKGKVRKPAIIFTPKSLLRLPNATSSVNKFSTKKSFEEIIVNDLGCKDIKRIVMCTGKVYYDLLAYKDKNNIIDTIIISIEQIYPMPIDKILDIKDKYPNSILIWCQEEPKNMGCWLFLLDKIYSHTSNKIPIHFVGRDSNPSTATGYAAIHKKEQEQLCHDAFALDFK